MKFIQAKGAVIITLVLGAYILPESWLPIDGVSGLLLSRIYKEDTEYAEKYSDLGFQNINVGMTQTEVHNILGSPLRKWSTSDFGNDNNYSETWSKSPGDTHYRIRQVRFHNNIVIDKFAEFYVD